MRSANPTKSFFSRPRRIGCLLLLLLASVLLWPHLKSLPRRAVAGWLANQLGAQVELEALRFESTQRIRLRGLAVATPTSLPEVEHVFVDEMVVEARLQQLLAGELQLLELQGVRLRLRPAPPTFVPPPPQKAPTIARLELKPAQVLITSLDGSEQLSFLVQAQLADFKGAEPQASTFHHLEATAEELSLRPLAELARVDFPSALATSIRHLHVELQPTASGEQLHLRANALHASLGEDSMRGEGFVAQLLRRDDTLQANIATNRFYGALGGVPFDLPSPSIALKAKEGDDGLVQLALEPRIQGLGQANLSAFVHPKESSWRSLEATIEDTQWDELWPALGLVVESDLRIVDNGQEVEVQLEAQSPRIHSSEADLTLENVTLSFQGLTAHPPNLNTLPTSLEIQSLELNHENGRFGDYSLPRQIHVQGNLQVPTWPSLQADLNLSGLQLFPEEPHHLKLESVHLQLASSHITEISQLKLNSLQAQGELGLPPQLPILPFSLNASGQPLPNGGLEFESFRFELPALANLEGSGSWRPNRGGRAHLSWSEVDLSRWQTLLSLSDFGFSFAGQGSAQLEARLETDGAWRLSGPAQFREAGFTSTDGGRVMEGLSADLSLQVEGRDTRPRKATAKGQAGNFVLLWGTFFGDFLDLSSDIEVQAKTDKELSNWQLETRVHLPDVFDLQSSLNSLSGDQAEEYEFNLQFAALDLRTAQQELLERFEGLSTIDLSGRLQVETNGRFRASDQWSAAGHLTLNDLRLSRAEATVDGLDLYFPIALEQRGSEFLGRRRLGDLRFNRLTVRDLEIPPLASALWVEADSFGLSEPLEVPVFGGQVILERLGISHLLRDDRSVESGLHLEALDLASISTDLELFPVEGTLEGNFPRMVLRGDDLEIEGGGRINLFGGTVEIRDIRGENLFTPFPELTLSTDFRDLDLGRLTRRIDFGEMTGILHGQVENCRLFRGVPVTCQATFRTEDRSGVKRTVDIKAVNNLTILGTGQSTNVLDRGVQRFLKRFTYAALGVELHLADDILRMRGLEKRGERELFLRGRLPFPIDIVNAQPGGAVSFQAMLRRLQSLDFSQVETSPP